MQAIGIIIEANPFHNGHKYLLEQAKQSFPDACFIAITSTSFTMRGEVSLINKFEKIDILLKQGFDLIFELPISLTLQSADYFSLNSINILNMINVDAIFAGTEITDLNFFEKIYNITHSNEFNLIFKEKLLLNNSYKITFSNSLKEVGLSDEEIELINKPNATLVYQYYKVIKENNYNITLHLIKRTNDYYQQNDNNSNIASATYIRENINNLEKISNYIPYTPNFIDLEKTENEIMSLLRFQTITYPTNNPFSNINGNIEGIDNYIMKNGDFSLDYKHLLDSLKNKKYSLNRIRRVLISLLLKLPPIEKLNYIRLLGLSKIGTKYLNKINKETKNLIFSSPNELKTKNILLEYEILSTKLYGILTKNYDLYLNEYKLPKKKED